jgi:UDP-N-acetylmuramate--alanine ligase
MKINIGQKEIIHFIGIGGIGMSGLAQIMKVMGFKVQGSDISLNRNIENCKDLGIKFFIGQKKKNIKDATILVKSSAIKGNNPEVKEAKKRKLPIYERVEMLSNIVSLKKNIIISGSHGKTTTTSLVSKILLESKLDPTIINGGVINSIKNNAKLGKGDWAVLEADESDGSFLKLPINYSIVTNIDKEHIDYYKNFKNLEKSFIKFINKTPPIGKCIICIDDKNVKKIKKKIKIKNILTYGFSKNSDYQIIKPKYNLRKCKFDLIVKNFLGKKMVIKNIVLNLIGKHNILNSVAAICVCLNLGIKIKIIKKALFKFSGVQRRMTKLFEKNENEFYDDYAHHPTEIHSVLEGVKKVSNKKKITSVFQPHRFSRVNLLKNEFSKSFKFSDRVILCPIYAAGEKISKKIDLLSFAKLISVNSNVDVIIVKNEENLKNYFKKNLVQKEIIIGMGAGSISSWMKNLKEFV